MLVVASTEAFELACKLQPILKPVVLQLLWYLTALNMAGVRKLDLISEKLGARS
jgi:hypothetical protein